MNVYDFDKTIYNGDSTFDFYRFCLKRHPKIILRLPSLLFNYCIFLLKRISKTEFKERMYKFLTDIDDIDFEIKSFWDKNIKKIKNFYKRSQKADDVIISASPEFLIIPACQRINIRYAYASKVNKHTGNYTGINCHGKEKVNRFYSAFPNGVIDNFYSDSYSDTPLAKLAKNSYIVSGENLKAWKF